jgi:type I restriction enzyme S subunit
MSEWKKVKLGEICEKITSGGTPKSNVSSFYNPGTIPWLKTKEVNYCRIYNTENHISEEGLAKSSAKLIPANSVIVAMYGQGNTAGRVAINKVPIATNQACCNLIIDEKKAHYAYIYYKLCTLYDKLVSLKNGGAQPNLNAKKISNLEIDLPSIDEQEHISAMLSHYDTLIENYQRQIKLLEEAAQRLYKEWFVDLHFPGYENTNILDGVPEGWEKETLGNIVPILTGKKDANFADAKGKYPFFTCAQDLLNAPSYSFDGSAVLLAGNGDFNIKLYRGKFEAYQRTYVLIPKELKYLFLIYNAIATNLDRLSSRAAGSTIKFLTKGMISSIPLLIPSDLVLKEYNCLSEEIQNKIELLRLQLRLLTEARDRLLPKLMSGEIEV